MLFSVDLPAGDPLGKRFSRYILHTRARATDCNDDDILSHIAEKMKRTR